MKAVLERWEKAVVNMVVGIVYYITKLKDETMSECRLLDRPAAVGGMWKKQVVTKIFGFHQVEVPILPSIFG